MKLTHLSCFSRSRRSVVSALVLLLLSVHASAQAGGPGAQITDATVAAAARRANLVASANELRVLDDDGAWSWFEGERALLVNDGQTLLVGAVSSGYRDELRRGDINVIVHDVASGVSRVVELHDRLERDDHDSPALLALDSEVLAIYARHGSDSTMRWRTAAGPSDGATVAERYAAWSPEQTADIDCGRYGLTYSNTARVYVSPTTGEERVINLFRGKDWNPQLVETEDRGETWSKPRALLRGPGRPYLRYATAPGPRPTERELHFAVSEQHPRNFDSGIRHGVLRGEVVLDSAGDPVGKLGDGASVTQLTSVFVGKPDSVAWCNDIRCDRASGDPVIVYSVQMDSAGLSPGKGGTDCRYRYAKLENGKWADYPLAFAGTRLYAGEDDYTGLVILDPSDLSRVVFSTDADPQTGEALISAADGKRHYELFRGVTEDGGATWTFAAITKNSSVDNIRPVFAGDAREERGAPSPPLIWLRGIYRTYQDFDLSVVALPSVVELAGLATINAAAESK